MSARCPGPVFVWRDEHHLPWLEAWRPEPREVATGNDAASESAGEEECRGGVAPCPGVPGSPVDSGAEGERE